MAREEMKEDKGESREYRTDGRSDEAEVLEPEVLAPPDKAVSEAALRELSLFLPGLGGLMDALAGSETFRRRLAQADARIEENLRRAGKPREAGAGPFRVRYGYDVRPLDGDG